MDKNKVYLYNLLFSGLIQIREDAHENKNKKVFWISNLLHNLPIQLLKEDVDYERLFKKIVEDARHNKMGEWIEKEILSIDQEYDQ